MEKTNTEKKTLRQWLSDHRPTKRRIIQLYAALLTNANLKGFGTGQIYQGPAKYACAPGLNCYSCPAASASCPLGAIQNALAGTNTKLPYYVIGILLLYGFLFGRWICGFLCPFGLIQDLLHKIPTPKVKKNRLTRTASYFKYVLLAFLVIALPLQYALKNFPLPGFCKYICPSGTLLGAGGLLSNENNTDLFAMLGPLFTWKFCLLVVFIVGSVFIYRFFCRFFCPMGALYGLFNKISWLGMKVDQPKCTNCGLCVGHCGMDIRHVGDHECISCGKCVNVCPTGAISYKGPKILLAPNEVGGRPMTKERIDPCDFPGTPLPKKTKIARLAVGLTMLAVLVGALVYYNFIYKDPEAIAPPPPPSSNVEVEVGGEVGNLCPDFEMSLYGEEGTIKPSDCKGKITVINFWYIYCSTCIHELQTEFNQLYPAYGDDIEILVVHSNNEYGQDINEFIKETLPSGVGFTHCRDVKNESFFRSLGGGTSYPGTIILDEDGIIRYKQIGRTTFKEMSEVIDGLLETNDAVVGGEIGNICPDYEMPLYGQDGTVKPSDSQGKVTVVNFWYIYCSACVHELKTEFDQLYPAYGDDVEILVVHTNNEYGQDINAWINANLPTDVGYTHCRDLENESFFRSIGGGTAYPGTLILDENGIIRYKVIGSTTYEEMATVIDQLLAE